MESLRGCLLGRQVGMGWLLQATAAVIAGGRYLDDALDWLFSHQEDLDAAVKAVLDANPAEETAPGAFPLLAALFFK